ncbi:hypothetical protein C5167_040039 [Papaver somniferum]|uniref:Uncharacterized protein n=1 Tax=Papaver somniferum TaxID=3469 RepID=A0A4Y7IG93_PAPSO|nr:hypothetical protein C5167_040039 [Papaver somniferum]
MFTLRPYLYALTKYLVSGSASRESVLGTDDRGFTVNENEAPSILTTVGDDEYWSGEAQEVACDPRTQHMDALLDIICEVLAN